MANYKGTHALLSQIVKAADGSVIPGAALLDNSMMEVELRPDDVIIVTPDNLDPQQVIVLDVELEVKGDQVTVQLIINDVVVDTVSADTTAASVYPIVICADIWLRINVEKC